MFTTLIDFAAAHLGAKIHPDAFTQSLRAECHRQIAIFARQGLLFTVEHYRLRQSG
jgi:hypothetical protein